MLSGLCSYDDVIARMADVGLATASDDESFNAEVIQRKITQSDAKITLDLTKKLQMILMPYLTDGFNNTPAALVDKITDEGKAFLKQCAIICTIQGMYEEGVSRMRFPSQEMPEYLKNILKYWSDMYYTEFESICPLLTFNQDGSGTITLMERLLMQNTSSVRVTV